MQPKVMIRLRGVVTAQSAKRRQQRKWSRASTWPDVLTTSSVIQRTERSGLAA